VEYMFPGFHAALNVHPMFVHFPIALWLTALLLWLLAVVTGRDDMFAAGRWLVYLGALGAAASVATGFVATAKMGHSTPGHDLVHTHRNIMVTAAGLGLVVAVATAVLRHNAAAGVQRLLLAGLLVTNLVLVVGADRGSLLVFGYGVGTAGLTPPHGSDHHHGGGGHDHGAAGTESSTAGHEHGEGHHDGHGADTGGIATPGHTHGGLDTDEAGMQHEHGVSAHEHAADPATGDAVGGEARAPHAHEHDTASPHSHSAAADGGSGDGHGSPVSGQPSSAPPPAHDHTGHEHGDEHAH